MVLSMKLIEVELRAILTEKIYSMNFTLMWIQAPSLDLSKQNRRMSVHAGGNLVLPCVFILKILRVIQTSYYELSIKLLCLLYSLDNHDECLKTFIYSHIFLYLPHRFRSEE